MYHKTVKDKYTIGQTETTEPLDRQAQIYYRTIQDD